MHLRRALAENRRRVEVKAHMFLCGLRRGMRRKFEWAREGVTYFFRNGRGGAIFVIAIEFFDGPLPAIALIQGQTLQHCERRSLAVFRFILDGARKRRNPIEPDLLREISANFTIGIDADILPAKKLQDEAVTEENRGITLLRRSAPDNKRLGFRPHQILKHLAADAPDPAVRES